MTTQARLAASGWPGSDAAARAGGPGPEISESGSPPSVTYAGSAHRRGGGPGPATEPGRCGLGLPGPVRGRPGGPGREPRRTVTAAATVALAQSRWPGHRRSRWRHRSRACPACSGSATVAECDSEVTVTQSESDKL